MARISLNPPQTLINRITIPLMKRIYGNALGEADEVTDEMVAGLREHLDNAQLVELTMTIAIENQRSRFNSALGLQSQGFSDSCRFKPLPERSPDEARRPMPEQVPTINDDAFAVHRKLMFGIAYRILGSGVEAEDVVQDTWLRWSDVDHDQVVTPRAYLARGDPAVAQPVAHDRAVPRGDRGIAGP